VATERVKNFNRIRLVAEKLSPLPDRVVFLGRSVVGCLLTDTGAPDVRPTLDVDVIIGVKTQREYHKLSESLRYLGFKEAVESDVICRWHIDDIVVDIMPTSGKILGFTNRWYPLAMETASQYEVTKTLSINLVSPPCFIATKIDAFESRGKQDFLLSDDINDIIYVVNGRPEIVDEIKNSDTELKGYLSRKFKKLLKNDFFHEAIQGCLRADMENQSRYYIIIERLKKAL
jgi:hypothetical protein